MELESVMSEEGAPMHLNFEYSARYDDTVCTCLGEGGLPFLSSSITNYTPLGGGLLS